MVNLENIAQARVRLGLVTERFAGLLLATSHDPCPHLNLSLEILSESTAVMSVSLSFSYLTVSLCA